MKLTDQPVYGRNLETEAQPLLVSGPVFKTGEGDEKSPWWVRFPCASAIYHPTASNMVLQAAINSGCLLSIVHYSSIKSLAIRP